jgi:hypothetical protein
LFKRGEERTSLLVRRTALSFSLLKIVDVIHRMKMQQTDRKRREKKERMSQTKKKNGNVR